MAVLDQVRTDAYQLAVDDRVGSIEVGKDADLVLYDGPPLSVFSGVRKTFVDGDLYFDREADRARQELIDDVKRKRGGKSEEEGEEPESETPPPTADEPETTLEVG